MLSPNDLILRKMDSLRLIESSAGNLSKDSPYRLKSISQMSEKKNLLKILD